MSSIDVKLQFRRITKVISAQADVAKGAGHASTTGSIREETGLNYRSGSKAN